jgi:hypothetical protein
MPAAAERVMKRFAKVGGFCVRTGVGAVRDGWASTGLYE